MSRKRAQTAQEFVARALCRHRLFPARFPTKETEKVVEQEYARHLMEAAIALRALGEFLTKMDMQWGKSDDV